MTFDFGSLLREKADEHKISVSDIAEKTGKHRQTVYNDFKKSSMNTEVIEQYCEVIGISLLELLESQEPAETVSGDTTYLLRDCQRELVFCKQRISDCEQRLADKDELIAALKAQLAMVTGRDNNLSQTA